MAWKSADTVRGDSYALSFVPATTQEPEPAERVTVSDFLQSICTFEVVLMSNTTLPVGTALLGDTELTSTVKVTF